MTRYRKECYKLFDISYNLKKYQKKIIKNILLNNSMFSMYDDIKSLEIITCSKCITFNTIQGSIIVTFKNSPSVMYTFNIFKQKTLKHIEIKCNIGSGISVFRLENKLKKYKEYI